MNEFQKAIIENQAKAERQAQPDVAEIQILVSRLRQYQTNHLLHLILSLLTAGFWIPVWMLVALSNGIERSRVRRKIRKAGGSQ